MLKLIVEQFLAFAEAQAMAHKPLYMKDWIEKLKLVLTMNEKVFWKMRDVFPISWLYKSRTGIYAI